MTHYAWQLIFDQLEETGSQRIVTLFKLGLKEMPRLEHAFTSQNPQDHHHALEEILALFGRIDIEMKKAMAESPLSPEEFIKEFKANQHFTPLEWQQLARVPELIGHHHKELLAKRAFDAPKKRNPFFKV